jgi:hypothetical protein
MNILRAAVTSIERIQRDTCALGAAGAAITATSLWGEVFFDGGNIKEPEGELVASGFTLAAVVLGVKAVRNYRNQQAEQISEQ